MRATATVLFITSLASTALGAATKFYSDDKCEHEIGKKVYNGFSTGDAPIPKEAVAIKSDSVFDVWYSYQRNDGKNCQGELILKLDNGKCYNLEKDLGSAGCTRLCVNGLGGGRCASSPA
ncbi:hypothetical protein VTG60DRAFT_917 [Thermothelomyces hinnuleus]